MYRAVGTIEYASALQNLDAFMQMASNEDRDAADRIVKARPQYVVHSGLSNKLRGLPEAFSSDPAKERQGLSWVIALARVE